MSHIPASLARILQGCHHGSLQGRSLLSVPAPTNHSVASLNGTAFSCRSLCTAPRLHTEGAFPSHLYPPTKQTGFQSCRRSAKSCSESLSKALTCHTPHARTHTHTHTCACMHTALTPARTHVHTHAHTHSHPHTHLHTDAHACSHMLNKPRARGITAGGSTRGRAARVRSRAQAVPVCACIRVCVKFAFSPLDCVGFLSHSKTCGFVG